MTVKSTFAATDPTGYERYMGRFSQRLAPVFVEWGRVPRGERVLDAYELPYADNVFDRTLSMLTLDVLAEPGRAMGRDATGHTSGRLGGGPRQRLPLWLHCVLTRPGHHG